MTNKEVKEMNQNQQIEQMEKEVIRLEKLIFAQLEPKNKLMFAKYEQDNKRFWNSLAILTNKSILNDYNKSFKLGNCPDPCILN